MRTWGSDVLYRNFKINDGNRSLRPKFKSLPVIAVNFAWDAITTAPEYSSFWIDSINVFNGYQAQGFELLSENKYIGVANSGLNIWGIAVRKGQKFDGRLYLKGSGLTGKVIVALQSRDGKKEYARQEFSSMTDNWERYVFKLTSVDTDSQARLVVMMGGIGKLWIDQVTLMSSDNDQFKGLPCRNDIGQAMVEQGLTFLRYGGTMINAKEYRLKK